MKLSAIVITKDEEANIARCLNSVSFANEQIVVDSNSTDRTAAIARQQGAKVFVKDWPGYGKQKNFGREQAQEEWLLFIDADEEVTPELRAEIKTIINSPADYDFYWLKIVTYFLNKPLHHLYGHNPRLFRRNSGRWTDAAVHEQVERLSAEFRAAPPRSLARRGKAPDEEQSEIDVSVDQIIKLGDAYSDVLEEPLLHHSHSTIRSYLTTMRTYTTLDAEEMLTTGKHRSGRPIKPSILLPWRLSFRQFIKLYFYRRGILDGWAGLLWCFLSAYYEYVMAQKYLAKQIR